MTSDNNTSANPHSADQPSNQPAPLTSRWREKAFEPLMIDAGGAPYDVRPEAYMIANRMESLRELRPDDPVILPMGEDHGCVRSQITQQAVLQECLNRDLVPAYAIETDHRAFESYMSHLEQDITPEAAAKVLTHDPRGALMRQLLVALATDAKDLQNYAFCDGQDIALRCCDARFADLFSALSVLDYDDDLTRETAVSLGYSICKDEINNKAPDDCTLADLDVVEAGGHYALSPAGFHIRNRVMVDNVLSFWRDVNPDVVILKTGNIHVYGLDGPTSDFQMPYEQSLTYMFRETATAVVPCLYMMKTHPLPQDADIASGVFIGGIDDEAEEPSDIIKRVADHSGGLVDYIDPSVYEDRSEYIRKFVQGLQDVALKLRM